MENIIGITRARNKIKDIIDHIMDDNEKYIVTRDANPEAVIISYSDYLNFKEISKKYNKLKNIDAIKNSKNRISELLSEYGIEEGKIPEEAILKIVKELDVSK